MAQDDTHNIITVQQLCGCYERLLDKIALLTRMGQQLIDLLSDDEYRDEEGSCSGLMEELKNKLAEVKYVVERPTKLSHVSGSVVRVELPKLDLPHSMVSTLNGHHFGTVSDISRRRLFPIWF